MNKAQVSNISNTQRFYFDRIQKNSMNFHPQTNAHCVPKIHDKLTAHSEIVHEKQHLL